MPNYNTQGITSADPRNLGGSEGYGNPSASSSSGLMSSTSNATANDDNNDEPGFFESIADLFSGAGADLPSDRKDDDGDSGASFYNGPMFAPYDGGSDNDTAPQGGLPFETTAADRALYEALGVDVPEVYTGKMGEEEPEPNLDMDVLQDALQPEPIIVEELEVKAGDTLSAIAKDKGVSLQSVIDANPQIKNPDLIRPGEKVTVPDPRFEGVPKPRGVPDSPRLSEGVADPRKIGGAESADAPVAAEIATGTDPRNLGGAEGYGSVGTPAEADTGEGLMSKPLTAVETATSSYSATTDAVYTDFYDNGEEGDAAHVGQDSQNLTLPAGIVADGGVTYNGKEVKAGKNTVKASEFDASKVDMSKAYKKVGGKTYKRADYDSDESWSKAVIEGFKDVVKSGAGDSWDDLDDGTKQAITKLSWNNGEGWAKYNTSKALYKELAKETKDKAIVAAGILNYSTVAGSGASIGVSKARANAWNKMADAHGFAEITKIEADNTGSKTKFNYYDVDGNLVHTETTSRSPTIYANGSNEKVEKDSAGNW